MTDNGDCRVREVAWAETCPWLTLFRTFRLAISVRSLLLATVAMLLTGTAWAVIGFLFSGNTQLTERIEAAGSCPWRQLTDTIPDRPGLPGGLTIPGPDDVEGGVYHHADPLVGTWALLSRPFRQIFTETPTVASLAYLLLCGLSTVAIWAFFGAAITRTAAVQLAAEERLNWTKMLHHCTTKWKAYFAAPLFPLGGVFLIVIPLFFLGLLLRANFGVFLAALVWPLMLIGGLLMAVLLLGLVFGWPLMWATISVEGTDSFDALSRSYAYVFQRPLHYLFYVIVAGVLGVLGWILVYNFAALVIYLTYWAASWGSGPARIALVAASDESLKPIGVAGANLVYFWGQCVKVLAVGYLGSYFWTAATAIYFLLRRDVDATEMDEIVIEEDEDEQTYGLPPLATDEAGAPIVTDESPDQPEDKLADEE